LDDSKRTLHWNADGTFIVVHSNQTLATINSAGEIVFQVADDNAEANFANVFISPHDPVLVTFGQNDDTTVFWNLETGEELLRLVPDNPRNLVWELGSGQAIVTEDTAYHTVDIDTGTTTYNEPEDVTTLNIDLRADGLLAIGSSPFRNFSHVFDFTTNTYLREFSGDVHWFTEDGEFILVVTNGIVAQHVNYPLVEEQENRFVEEFERFEMTSFEDTGRLYVFGNDDLLHLYQISAGA
jgi:WD40 repeat protein